MREVATRPATSTLSTTEQATLSECEATIKAGLTNFFEVGTALLKIRDDRLYRDTHQSFEDYCNGRWDMGKRRANQLIAAVGVAEVLQTPKCQNGQEVGTVVPTSERQLRPLTSLPSPHQQEAWNQAVAESNGNAPTAKKVQEIVDRKTLVNGKPGHDLYVERQRKAGRIPADVVVDVTEPGAATSVQDVAEDIAERESIEHAEQTPEEYVDSLPLTSQLQGVSRDVFRRDALFYLAVDEFFEGHNVKPMLRKLLKQFCPGSKIQGRFMGFVAALLRRQHPRDWKICPPHDKGGCDGMGSLITGQCPTCHGKGYVSQ